MVFLFQGKKKGGWPKGRKRKPPDIADIKPPKAPSTGYVLYLIDKRKHYKNLPFHEVSFTRFYLTHCSNSI